VLKLIQISAAVYKYTLNLVESQGRIENMFRRKILVTPYPGLVVGCIDDSLHMAADFHLFYPLLI
jgi:hypothetical protein